jgi:hypothetical protein
MFDKSKAPKCHDCKKYPARRVEKHGKKILSLCDDCSFRRDFNEQTDKEINRVLKVFPVDSEQGIQLWKDACDRRDAFWNGIREYRKELKALIPVGPEEYCEGW